MTYLNLDKSKLVNLEYSLSKEILRTNRAGSYSSTTIIGCNTRKYHGMLVSPIKEFSDELFVLLSSLDITLIQHNQEFNLGIHKYQGNHYEPKGHKYMTDFELDHTPKRIYKVGGMQLVTELLLTQNEEQLLFKVTLTEATSPTKIRFKPFLAFRNIHELTSQNMVANTRYDEIENGIRICMYEGFPDLFMQISKLNEFIAVPDWFRGIEYYKEQQRGYAFKEDLFVPGYFELDIAKGESIVFSAATKQGNPRGFKGKFTREINKRVPRNTLLHNLLNSASQFILKDGKSTKLIAGYHWYHERLRDTLIALPGLMAYQEDKSDYLKILDQAVKDIRSLYLISQDQPTQLKSKEVDIPLWLFYAIQEIEKAVPHQGVFKKYESTLCDLIQYIVKLQNGPVHLAENGLIYAKIESIPLTWMNAIVDNQPVTWRPGFTVEVNALWYNALKYISQASTSGKIKDLEILIEKAESSFINTFWNEEGKYLYDYVDYNFTDNSIRPNQIIAAALPFTPLSREQCKLVIDIVKKELLSPKGLRTLSPSSPQYKGVLEGSQRQRDLARHQGSVFPWLSSFFAEAYLNVHKQSGAPFIKKMIDDFEEEMSEHCISTIPECFNGNPPHIAKEAVSMAWSVAAVIKLIKLIENYN